MLKSQHRIRKDREYKKIFRFSKSQRSGNLEIKYFKNNSDITRFGFVISNKVEKKATRRNSLKRKLRAMAKEVINNLKAGFDVIVIVKSNYAHPYSYDQIKDDFIQGLEKSGMLL